jgi:hypothetical protein
VRAKPFFIVFFAVAALLGVVSVYMSATIDKADKAISAFVSPDGKYKAVRTMFSGGGASPFCFDSISVLLAVYPDDIVERNKSYEMFSAPCDAPEKRATSPKIEWLSPTALQISYAANTAGFNEKKAVMKPLDVTKVVHVTFVARD